MSQEIQCSVDRPCAAVQLLVQSQNTQAERMNRFEMDTKEDIKKLDTGIESLKNRLPLWATAVATAGAAALGVMATIIAK